MEVSVSAMLPMNVASDPRVQDVAMNGDRTEEAAISFEAVFASMLIKEMRQSFSSGLFGEENSDVYGAMFDEHLGQVMAEAGGFGIKELVLSQQSAGNAAT